MLQCLSDRFRRDNRSGKARASALTPTAPIGEFEMMSFRRLTSRGMALANSWAPTSVKRQSLKHRVSRSKSLGSLDERAAAPSSLTSRQQRSSLRSSNLSGRASARILRPSRFTARSVRRSCRACSRGGTEAAKACNSRSGRGGRTLATRCRSKARCSSFFGRALQSATAPSWLDSIIRCSPSRPAGRADASSSAPPVSEPAPNQAKERPWKRTRSCRKLAGKTFATARASLELMWFRSSPSFVSCFGMALAKESIPSSTKRHPPRKLASKESSQHGSADERAFARPETAWLRSSRLSPDTRGKRGAARTTETSLSALSSGRSRSSVASTASPAAPDAKLGRLSFTRRCGESLRRACVAAKPWGRLAAPARRRCC
mmetsp:Transcript_44568/g.80109  ORF Transcript_44568/g.80109 Transcript_44568/m.80109 type:complete len:375 (-) Transcript_44568:674-1798(-)